MAHIPPHFMDSLVALEQGAEEGPFTAVASGVLVGLNTGDVDTTSGNALYRTVLFTNRHVVSDVDHLWAKFNQGDAAARFRLDLNGPDGAVWHSHEEYDVAAIAVNARVLQDAGADFKFVPEEQLLTVSQMQELGVAAGDDLYVLGFPMGLAGIERLYAIVRGGTLARFDDELIRHEQGYLIDSSIYPGNSGGPVALRPSLMSISGTTAVSKAGIIGIVSGYLPYRDVAVSPQTGKTRVVFEENSGLAKVVPAEAMLAACEPLRPQAGAHVDKGETATEDDLGA